MSERLIVIGGVVAGRSAAAKARRTIQDSEIGIASLLMAREDMALLPTIAERTYTDDGAPQEQRGIRRRPRLSSRSASAPYTCAP